MLPPVSDFIRTSIYGKYSASMKITARLDHVSHCKTSSGTSWSNGWSYRVFIIKLVAIRFVLASLSTDELPAEAGAPAHLCFFVVIALTPGDQPRGTAAGELNGVLLPYVLLYAKRFGNFWRKCQQIIDFGLTG